MSDSNNLLQGINPTEDLIGIKNKKSLKNVYEEIQQAIDVVERTKDDIKNAQIPHINGKPWYKFSFGKASVEEVNTALKTFSDFVIENLRLIAVAQGFQNENDQSICRLIGLLAIAEANTYSKINDLSTEDEASAEQLKRLQEEFEKSIENSKIDCSKKGEQMNLLIDYITCFTESKTKKIRSITLELSELKHCLMKLQKQIQTQEAKIEEYRKEAEDKLSSELQKIQGKYVASEEFETLLKRYQNLENKVYKKSFFDSIWYKGAIGIISISALAISIFAAF